MKTEDLPAGFALDPDTKALTLGAGDWTRDNEKLAVLLAAARPQVAPPLDAAIAELSDDDVKAVELWALSSLLDAEYEVVIPDLPAFLQPPKATEPVAAKPAAPKPPPKPPATAAAKVPALSEEQVIVLRNAGESRYGLYKFPDGYGASAASFNTALVEGLVTSGHLVVDESGGAYGSVKISEAGRKALQVTA